MKVLQFTDLHEDTSRLENIINHLEKYEDEIDVVLNTGDTTGSDGKNKENFENKINNEVNSNSKLSNLENKIQDFMNDNNINNQSDLFQLDDDLKEKYFNMESEKSQLLSDITEKAYEDSINKLKPYFKTIDDSVDHFIGIAGNHDLNLIYDSLGDYMTFIDKEEKYEVDMNENSKMIFKGLINSPEIPKKHRLIPEDYHINYQSSSPIEDNYSDDLKELLKNSQEKEKNRLNGFDCDIMLFHKDPRFDSNKYGDSCQVSHDFYDNSNASSSYNGHIHGGYVHVDEEGKVRMNPGINHFFQVEYKDDKSIKSIKIYRYESSS